MADTKDMNLSPYKVDMQWDSSNAFEVLENENDTAVTDINPTSLSWRQFVGTNSTATATNITLAPKDFVKGSTDVEALRFKIKAGSASLVNVKELNFASTPSLTNTTISNATLSWTGGSKSVTISNGSLSFEGMDINIPASTELQFSLKVGISKTTSTSSFVINAVDATAEDKDQNTVSIDVSAVDGRNIGVAAV